MRDILRKSCVFYDSWAEQIVNLPDQMAGEFIKWILKYEFFGETIHGDDFGNPALYAMIVPICRKLDEDEEEYNRVVNKKKEAAQKRWADSKTMQIDADVCTCNADECTPIHMDGDNESDNDNESVNDKKNKRFIKPSVDEVRAYCQERQNKVDPETFVDFYESKGWKVGSNPMKDWKSAVRTWEKRSSPTNKASPMDKIHSFGNERKTDYGSFGAEFINA